MLSLQITSPMYNTQKDGEPVPTLPSYSRGLGRFVGNHYIKVNAFTPALWWAALSAQHMDVLTSGVVSHPTPIAGAASSCTHTSEHLHRWCLCTIVCVQIADFD